MKGQTKPGWKAITLLLACAALGAAQVNSLSAPTAPLQDQNGNYAAHPAAAPVGPGAVNYVEGQVLLNGQTLSSGSVGSAALKPGQLLETNNGYVEILLTPGAFLRVGNNSQVRLPSAGLADTSVELVQGSGMLEVDQLIKGTNLTVEMSNTTTQIEKKGLYNFDASQGAIRVLDGKAKVIESTRSQTLGKHDQVLLASDHPLKRRSFDENLVKNEPLYVWSRARSEDESRASLTAASNAGLYAAAGPGWYWDPYMNYYGFWPVAGALYSPFGWGFYSPAYFGFYGGYYGGGYSPGWYGHRWTRNSWHGRVGGVNARVGGSRSAFHGSRFHGSLGRSHSSGFHGSVGGFHGGGFHSGGFGGGSHAGGGHR